MGLFDAISGAAYSRAAKNNAAAIGNNLMVGSDQLTNAYNSATNLLGTPQGSGTAMAALGQGYGQARTDLGNQYAEAQGFLGRARDVYDPVAQGGADAYSALLDAIGANGAEGSARAGANFKNSLGYNAGLDEGLGRIQALAASRGMLASGNTSRDLYKYASDYQARQSQNYINNLAGQVNPYLTAISGQAQGYGNQAQASQTYGAQLGSLGTGLGQAQSGVFMQGAQNNANFGNALAGLGTLSTNALVQNSNNLAKAQTDASSNLLGGILGGASSIFKSAGQAGGFGKLFS